MSIHRGALLSIYRKNVEERVNMTISLSTSAFQPTEMYFLLRDSVVPRPIAWVSTISDDGVSNIAPYSFFNVVCPWPAILGFSCGPRGENHNTRQWAPKDTYVNIMANKAFVVNIVPESMTDAMVETAADLPPGQSEFPFAGLTEAPSTTIKPPRVLGAPVAYECTLYDVLDAGSNKWIMGTVQHVHIDESVYVGRKGNENHRVDVLAQEATRPVGRLGRANYVRLREIETKLRRDGPNQ
jgi:flavin reductase (DIM6/NTAB) family NADH-FMN oxidoreductase RutF